MATPRPSDAPSFYDRPSSRTAPHSEAAPHTRKDSTTSSFFGATARPSTDALAAEQGYTRDSHYAPVQTPGFAGTPAAQPTDPETGWDVFADFNNTGPKYSNFKAQTAGYQPIRPPANLKGDPSVHGLQTADGQPVELVTVPALGPEWRADELKAMTQKGRREEKRDKRRDIFKAWNRDQVGLCGGWGTRRAIVWSIFGLCCITGIILAFTIPRIPGFAFNAETPLGNSTLASVPDPAFGTFPANFTFYASIDVVVDTNANFLPLHFNSWRSEIYDLNTGNKIATGEWGSYTLPAKQYTRVFLPVTFSYAAANTTDKTWAKVYNSCRNSNQFEDKIRPGMDLTVVLYMNIAGLPNQAAASKVLTAVPCPFELSASSS